MRLAVSLSEELSAADLAHMSESDAPIQRSCWFKHPECRVGLWWQAAVEVRKGLLSVSLAHQSRAANPTRPSSPASASSSSFSGPCCSTSVKREPQEAMVVFPEPREGSAAERKAVVICAVLARVTMKYEFGESSSQTLQCMQVPRVLGEDSVQPLKVGTGCRVEYTEMGMLNQVVVAVTVAYVTVPQDLELAPAAPSTSHVDAMFDAQEFGAVSLVLDSGEQVFAYKAALGAASPKLQQLFEGSLHQPVPTRLHLQEVDIATLSEALRFIYTGRVSPTLGGNVKLTAELMNLARNWEMPRLHSIAELALVGSVVGEEPFLLQVAESCNAAFLKEVILFRMSILNFRKEWLTLVSSSPQLTESFLSCHEVAVAGVRRQIPT